MLAVRVAPAVLVALAKEEFAVRAQSAAAVPVALGYVE